MSFIDIQEIFTVENFFILRYLDLISHLKEMSVKSYSLGVSFVFWDEFLSSIPPITEQIVPFCILRQEFLTFAVADKA